MNTNKCLSTLAAAALIAIGGAGLSTVVPSVPIAGATSFVAPLPLEPASTVSQRNAVRAAKQYLNVSAFSRDGLIDQLEYSDYSTEDATFAVDNITVDWNEQAAKAAEQYLNVSAFSRGGLIDQLVYSGFTPAQAAYGASSVGL